MAERPPPPPPEAHPLTARELQLAILYAHGLSIMAIDRCVDLAGGVVERHLIEAYRKMNPAVKGSPPPTHRSEMHDWLDKRGLLPDQGALEAVVDRAISALEKNYPGTASLPPELRESLEKHLADERALLAEAHRAIRETFAQEA